MSIDNIDDPIDVTCQLPNVIFQPSQLIAAVSLLLLLRFRKLVTARLSSDRIGHDRHLRHCELRITVTELGSGRLDQRRGNG